MMLQNLPLLSGICLCDRVISAIYGTSYTKSAKEVINEPIRQDYGTN